MAATRVLTVIPQKIPSATCLSCRVCCHFPDRTSALRPFFTANEIQAAVSHGIDLTAFPDPSGSHVAVVPNPSGDGYICPAYDPTTSECRVYHQRPLDCRLYPLALMWNQQGDEVWLGWDTNCPFPTSGTTRQYADRVAAMIERDYLDTVAQAPMVIGRYQKDVIPIRALAVLTARVSGASRPTVRHALTLRDRSRLEEAIAYIETPLAAFGVAPLFLWNELLPHTWTELEGCLCVFADSPDGCFMPLPPLGPAANMLSAAHAAFGLMCEQNGGSAVSRIENVPASLVPEFQRNGWRLTEKDPDYLYEARRLAALAGDPYKAQRHAINQLARAHHVTYGEYRPNDQDDCLALHRRWMAQQESRGLADAAAQMLADAASAHRIALRDHAAIGLVGRVLRVDGSVVAYTFGYPQSASTFCVALEVADRSVPGAAAYLFREFCREAAARGAAYINTMDDSGLSALAHAKQAYHPFEMVRSYIATLR